MRISTQMMYNSVRGSMDENRTALQEKQLQISTGNRYLNRSDNPTNTSLEATVTQFNTKNTQWLKNISDAYDFTQFSDNKVGQIKDQLQRVNELVVSINNGTEPPEYRKQVATEVNSVLEDLYQLANSNAAGKYLFGGTATSAAPFNAARNAAGEITGVTYSGNTTFRSIQTGETATVDKSNYGILGATPNPPVANDERGMLAYHDSRPTPTAAHPTWVNPRRENMDIFQNLVEIRDALAAGDIPQDVEDDGTGHCYTPLADLQYNLNHVIEKYVETGVQAKQFKSMTDDFTNMELVYKTQISMLGDTDIASAATELSQLQASYQASLQIATKVDDLSLLKYI